MKIGVIGPEDSIKIVLELKDKYKNSIELIPYSAYKIQDSIEIAKKYQEETDGLLFTGCGVYDSIIRAVELYKPHVYVPHNESSLFTLILKELTDNINSVSIDVIQEDIVSEIIPQTTINNYKVLPYKNGFNEENFIDFHNKNLKDGTVDTVFTAFSFIYDYYKKRNIPVYRLYTTKFSIRSAITSLVNGIKNNRVDNSKISIQIIKLNVSKENLKTKFTNLDRVLDFEKSLVSYLKTVNGAIFNLSWNEYILFTTKGYIKSEEAKRQFNIILTKTKFEVYSGIGIGYNAAEAEYNAISALKYSKKDKNNTFYIMNEDKKIEGPIFKPTSLIYKNNSIDTNYDKVSEEIGLSINYLQKIKSIMKLYDKNSFTSNELAHYLGISERSARRILKKLTDTKYGEIIANENKAGAGRPINIIKIKGL